MIYELRTVQLIPGAVPEYERRLEAALPARQRHSRLAGCWHTEIGTLQQVVELWPYESEEQRASVLAALEQESGWPPRVDDLVQQIEIELLHPAPFMRPLDGSPQRVGPIFEFRIYQVRTGQVPEMIAKWTPMVPEREKLSPLLGCWYSDQGRWFHLWPYPDMASRMRIRAEAIEKGIWPPPTTPNLLMMSTKIMLPAAFSPLQ